MRYLLYILTICSALLANAQPPITGKILSPSLIPISGATIAATTSTTTRADGSFSILLNHLPDTITITAIGYAKKRVAITKATSLPINITLQETTATLDEVVVNTGYQRLPKERATGSFTQLSNEVLNQQVSTTILNRLEAVTNGLTVSRRINNGGQILVRGLSTMTGPKDPLIILDNFPYSGDINNINPNDVESVTVLKDAAAASIWGTRAGNGVIVITTKKSNFNRPLQVSLTSNIAITGKPNLFYLPTMNPSDAIDVEQFLFSKNYRFSDTSSSSKPPFSPVYELLFKQRNGQLAAADVTNQINAFRQHDLRDDFLQYIYRPSVNQQYAITVKSGAAASSWLLAAGVDRNLSDVAARYNRLNLRSDNNFKIGNNLTASTGIYLTQSKAATGMPAYGDIATIRGRLPVYTKLADDNGNPLPIYKDYRQVYIDSAGMGKLLDWKYYPLTDYTHIDNTTTITNMLAKAGLRYSFWHDLAIDINYQYELQNTKGRNYQDADSYTARDLVNKYSQLNRTTGIVTYKVPVGGILDMATNQIEAHNIRGQLSYTKFWQKHTVAIITGGELRAINNNSNASRLYGYNNDNLTFGNVDLATAYPSFVNAAASFIPSGNTLSATRNRYVSAYANAAYTYLGQYTVSASMRRDAANNFGVATNDKWTPLWSAGATWEISKAAWYKLAALPYLKLRTTYGISGNVDPSKSALTTISYSGTSPYTLTPYATIDKFYNPNLRWEKTAMLNLGVDFKTKSSRFYGSIEYYLKNCTDLYGTSVIDYTAGLATATITKNIASIKASGVDIELNSVNIAKGNWQWTTQAIVNMSKDKITNNYITSTQGSNLVGSGFTGVVGSPVFSVKTYRWAGLDPATGDPQGFIKGAISKDYTALNGSGTQLEDLVFNGAVLPVVYGSLGNTVAFKGFAITARITYKLGYFFQRSSINYSSLFASSQGHPDYAKRWQQPGDETKTNVPSMVYPAVANRDAFYNNSEVLVEKGDHIRLQYINCSYSLPKTFLKPWCKSLSVFININNIGILWRANKQNLDPDYANGIVPPSKTIALGLQASF